MSYLTNNLLSGEQVLFRTKKHVIIFCYPVLLTLFACMAAYGMMNNPILAPLWWAPILVALFFCLSVLLQYWTSVYAVTNKRIMMKEGFFIRHSNETQLKAISQVNITQGPVGQIINYGTVSIQAFGANDVFSMVANAVKLQYYINQQLDIIRN